MDSGEFIPAASIDIRLISKGFLTFQYRLQSAVQLQFGPLEDPKGVRYCSVTLNNYELLNEVCAFERKHADALEKLKGRATERCSHLSPDHLA